jgi:hypothetical protein
MLTLRLIDPNDSRAVLRRNHEPRGLATTSPMMTTAAAMA